MKPLLKTTLSSIPFFSGLTDEEIASMVAAGSTAAYAEGEVIFEEGDRGSELYIILDGLVEISQQRGDAARVSLATLREGEYFGEMALIDGLERSAAAMARASTSVFVLKREAMLDLLSSNQHLLSDLLQSLSGRVRRSNVQYTETKLESDRLRTQGEIERHRAISQMVAGVAHEINTPLGIVNNAVSVIADSLKGPELAELANHEEAAETLEDITEAVKLIQGNIDRANRLIRSFKDLSARQASDALEEVDLAELVGQIVDLFRIEAKRAGIELKLESKLDGVRRWRGHPGHLSQILLNLLSNAGRYAFPDRTGGRVEVTVREDSTVQHYVVEVRDHGVGMDEQKLSRVFEPFFTTGRDRGGTGLGMAIVRNLATDSLRGTVEVQSVVGAGTTVTVSFPTAVDESATSSSAKGTHDRA